jgi:hypothetical protein
MRSILVVIILLLLIIIFYLSWRSEPHIGNVWFLPKWLGRWADEPTNENVRTAVPFFALGILTGIYLLGLKLCSIQLWCSFLLLLFVLVILTEAGQLLLPHRFFDWGDIAWGATGSLTGLIIPVIPTAVRCIKNTA